MGCACPTSIRFNGGESILDSLRSYLRITQTVATSAFVSIIALLAVRCEFTVLFIVFLLAISSGLYSIWSCKKLFFVSSCVLISVAILASSINELAIVLGIAIFFILYIEFGHSVTRFYELGKMAADEKTGGTMVMHLQNATKRYICLCSLVILFTFILTLLLLNLTTIFSLFSDKIAESIELNSVYGIIVWVAIVYGFFWLSKAVVSKI